MGHLVVAKKYKLKVKKEGLNSYDENGTKELIHEDMAVPMSVVENSKHQANNILYVVNEEETKKRENLRSEVLKKKAEDKKKQGHSQADIVDAIVELGKASKGNSKKKAEPKKEETSETKK